MKKFYITLDSLLDTRLGVIRAHSKEAAENIIECKDYLLREFNNWELFTNGIVDDELFEKLYSERGGDNTQRTLSNSIITNIIPVIYRLIAEELNTIINNSSMDDKDVIITVDTSPYSLNDVEKEELLIILNELFSDKQAIELTEVGITELTPRYIYNNFALVIMYDFHEWIKLHFEELVKIRGASVNYIAPKLFERDVSTLTIEEKKRELLKFKMVNFMYMNFNTIDTRYFSRFSKT